MHGMQGRELQTPHPRHNSMSRDHMRSPRDLRALTAYTKYVCALNCADHSHNGSDASKAPALESRRSRCRGTGPVKHRWSVPGVPTMLTSTISCASMMANALDVLIDVLNPSPHLLCAEVVTDSPICNASHMKSVNSTTGIKHSAKCVSECPENWGRRRLKGSNSAATPLAAMHRHLSKCQSTSCDARSAAGFPVWFCRCLRGHQHQVVYTEY